MIARKTFLRHFTSPIFRRLLATFLKPHLKMILFSSIAMIIVALSTAGLLASIKSALDDVFLDKNQEMLNNLPIIIIGLSIVKSLASYFQNFSIKLIGQKVVVSMQMQLYEHLLKSDINFLSKFATGRLLSRFTNDMTLIRIAVSDFLTGMAREVFTVIFLIALMFWQDAFLAAMVFTVFPLTIFPLIHVGRKIRKISSQTQHSLETYTSRLDDSFKNIRVIKAYMSEEFEINRAGNLISGILSLYRRTIKADSIISPLTDMLSGVAIAVVIVYGGGKIIDGSLTPGNIVAFLGAFIAAYRPMKNLAELNNNLQEGLAVAERFFQIIDEKPQIINCQNPINLTNKQFSIEFQNVNFAYENSQILHDINFKIEPGQTIAFVGSSGSGKSTIVNLILRFFDIKSGVIKIAENNIKDIEIHSLRSQFALVTQESLIFEDSISANIAYGEKDLNFAKIEKAAKNAVANEFIENLPAGFDEIAAQNGSNFSGGQKQRISIARALYKNPEIMILDEATSALDSITEMQIHENLKKSRQNKTTIIIAHRISTIKNADVIFVMENGKIVQQGNHEDLIKSDKETYRNLYDASVRS